MLSFFSWIPKPIRRRPLAIPVNQLLSNMNNDYHVSSVIINVSLQLFFLNNHYSLVVLTYPINNLNQYIPSMVAKHHEHQWTLQQEYQAHPSISIWVKYNNSLTWIKAIFGLFPVLTMIIVRSQWGRYNLPRFYIVETNLPTPICQGLC